MPSRPYVCEQKTSDAVEETGEEIKIGQRTNKEAWLAPQQINRVQSWKVCKYFRLDQKVLD